MPRPKGLTPLQARFVDEYLIDLCATHAAIRAGYSPNTAKDSGNKNLRRPHIAKLVQEKMDERAKRTEINQDWVLKRLALLADANPKQLASWDAAGVEFKDSDALTDDEAYTIAEVVLKETIKAGEGEDVILSREKRLRQITDTTKAKALELIGKHLGMFTDRVQLGGLEGAPSVQVTFVPPS